MHDFPLTTEQQAWKERTAEIAEHDIGPRAADYDRRAQLEAELKATWMLLETKDIAEFIDKGPRINEVQNV